MKNYSCAYIGVQKLVTYVEPQEGILYCGFLNKKRYFLSSFMTAKISITFPTKKYKYYELDTVEK